jgi:hypothetical protein
MTGMDKSTRGEVVGREMSENNFAERQSVKMKASTDEDDDVRTGFSPTSPCDSGDLNSSGITQAPCQHLRAANNSPL